MSKYNLGIAILLLGIITIIGNFPSAFSKEEVGSLTTGIIISLIGIMYMTKHKKSREKD